MWSKLKTFLLRVAKKLWPIIVKELLEQIVKECGNHPDPRTVRQKRFEIFIRTRDVLASKSITPADWEINNTFTQIASEYSKRGLASIHELRNILIS